MPKFPRFLAMSAAAALSIAGLSLGAAAPAQAGTSIPKTYNGGTGVYYAFYASNNKFCIDPSSNVTLGQVKISHTYSPDVVSLEMTQSAEGGTVCEVITGHGFKEGERIRFELWSDRGMSVGYATL